MTDGLPGSLNDAQTVIEAALAEAKEKLAQAERDREHFLRDARSAAELCHELRRAIASYHKALGRNADGTPRKSRRKEVTAEPDRAACTGATADSEDDGNQ